MLKKISISKLILIITVLFFLIGYIVYPLYHLFTESVAQKDSYPQLLNSNIIKACSNSILLSLLTVMGSCIIGVLFAYIFHFHKFSFKPFFSTFIMLPMATPPMVGVMAFLFLAGENGLISKVLGLDHFKFESWPAILTIHLYSFYPLFFLFAGNALKSIDNNTIDASYSLGAGKLKTFFSIIFPQLIPSLIGASLLTFMASMASFSAPFIFGGSDRFLTTEIYYSKINGDTSFSAALAILLTLISVGFLFSLRWYRNTRPATAKSKGTIKSAPQLTHKKYNYLSMLAVLLFCVAILLPIISLFVLALLPDNALMQSGLSLHFTFDNFRQLFSVDDFFQPFVNSLLASLAAILLTLALGLAAAAIIRGKKSVLKSWIEIIISLPYGIPGTVIAICLILSFNSETVFSFNTILVGTFWILPIAYAIRNLPILTQALVAGLHYIDPSLEEASVSLGASTLKTWRYIILPLIFPFMVQGALLVFINSFGEFVATILLYTFSTKTISVEVYSQLRMYNNGIAAAYGVILFLIVISVVSLSGKVLKTTAI